MSRNDSQSEFRNLPAMLTDHPKADVTSARTHPTLYAHWCNLKRLLTKEDETIFEAAVVVTAMFLTGIVGLWIGSAFFEPATFQADEPVLFNVAQPIQPIDLH